MPDEHLTGSLSDALARVAELINDIGRDVCAEEMPMTLTVTGAQLRTIGSKAARNTDALAAAFNEHAPKYGLDVERRAEHFVSQLAHESGGFLYYKELWGPTPAQRGYEGRRNLGNTHPGDGSKYRGYGLIQVTGRANVTEFDAWCRKRYPDCPDFVARPEKLALLPWALISAFWYWDTRGLNKLADADDLTGITRKINGGLNGLADRRYRYGLAARAIVTDNPAPPKPVKDATRPTLKRGATGEAVKTLQAALGTVVDGEFGNGTALALIAFQRAHGLLPDGICGGLCWAALDAAATAKAA